MGPRLPRTLAIAAAAVVLVAGIASIAPARMSSTSVGPLLCETTGGGRFVEVPGFPGEMIDRRLLADIRWLARRYPILITDGYSMSDVHSENGEHPLGLALDIVPDKAAGGTWAEITRLARWAEPKQGDPRAPFRWVGYTGDANHGPRNHLHLSWAHSEARPGRPAKLINTLRCPGGGGGDVPIVPADPPTGGAPEGEAPSANDERGRGRGRGHGHAHGGGHAGQGGGVSPRISPLPAVAEADGVGRHE